MRTIRRAPTDAAASSTCRVPSTLTRAINATSGIGIDHAGEVHDHVDALEQRLELGAGDVDPGEFDRAGAPLGLAHVEAEDAFDVGMRGEDREEVTARRVRMHR